MTYISNKLPVVEVTLEDNQLARLEVLVQLGRLVRQPPEAARVRPEAVGPEHQLTLGVEGAPLLKQELELVHLGLRQRRRRLVLQLVLLGRCLVKVARGRHGAEKRGKVRGEHV